MVWPLDETFPIPSVAPSVDIGKEQRDYVGRWHVNQHQDQSADYVHKSRQIVTKVQESVNRSICTGGPVYDESEESMNLDGWLGGITFGERPMMEWDICLASIGPLW